MDGLSVVRPVLGASRWRRLGSLSNGSVDLDPVCGLDVVIERTVGMGPLSLWTMGLPAGNRLGVGAWNRAKLCCSTKTVVLPMEASPCLLLQRLDVSRQLRWLVSAHTR